jgi:hypothetical protein
MFALPFIEPFNANPAHELRNKLAFARPRQRQGARTRFAAAIDEIRAAGCHLRCAVSAGDPAAVLDCVALLNGVSADAARSVTVCAEPSPQCGVLHIDATSGLMWTDLGRIELQDAAKPRLRQPVVAAERWIPRPMPALLCKVIAKEQINHGELTDLGQLFHAARRSRGVAVDGQSLGRLRLTLPRLQAGLVCELLATGFDAHTVALSLNAFAQVPRARLFYIASPAQTLAAASEAIYSLLDWGPPVAAQPRIVVGSQVVPTEDALVDAWAFFCGAAEQAMPGRRCTMDRAIEHHNRYVLAVGWLLSFLIGARESKCLGFSAASCRDGCTYVAYGDKRTGSFGSARPALLCSTAQRQVRLYWSHLRAFAARATRQGLVAQWLTHAKDALSSRDVSMLFTVADGCAHPVGTTQILAALPSGADLSPNWGRHYWQTTLHAAGVRSDIVDFFARHAACGTESMTSTTLLPLATAHQHVDRVQQATLARLRIEALAGQGRRSAQ